MEGIYTQLSQPLFACHAWSCSAWLEHAESNSTSPVINNYQRTWCYHRHPCLFVGFNRSLNEKTSALTQASCLFPMVRKMCVCLSQEEKREDQRLVAKVGTSIGKWRICPSAFNFRAYFALSFTWSFRRLGTEVSLQARWQRILCILC